MKLFVLTLYFTSLLPCLATDWPHFRGPDHNGVSSEMLPDPLPAGGPTLIWKRPIDAAFSSFTVAGGKAITQVTRLVGETNREVCVALDANSGTELWATPLDLASYPDAGTGGEDGPRTTPSIENGFVYVLTSYLKLAKLNANNGAVVWLKDLVQLYGAQLIPWQNAASPLLEGDNIYLNCNSPAGKLLALRKSDGGLVWQTGADVMTHSSPVPATIGGVRQIIFFTQSGLVAVRSNDGLELWRHAHPFNTSTSMSPVVDGDVVFCSAAYQPKGAAIRVTASGNQFTVTPLWQSTSLYNDWSTPVVCDGYMYGMFGRYFYDSTPLKCVSLLTGETMWSEPGLGCGGILLVNNRLIVADTAGGIRIVEAYPRSYNELARFDAVQGKSWNAPAFSNGRLYTRSVSEAACYDLTGQGTTPPRLVQRLERLANGTWRLEIRTEDATPLDAARVGLIQVKQSNSLITPAAAWTPIPELLTYANGALEVVLPDSGQTRYFLTAEQQP